LRHRFSLDLLDYQFAENFVLQAAQKDVSGEARERNGVLE
jgi:hypothetical protein